MSFFLFSFPFGLSIREYTLGGARVTFKRLQDTLFSYSLTDYELIPLKEESLAAFDKILAVITYSAKIKNKGKKLI